MPTTVAARRVSSRRFSSMTRSPTRRVSAHGAQQPCLWESGGKRGNRFSALAIWCVAESPRLTHSRSRGRQLLAQLFMPECRQDTAACERTDSVRPILDDGAASGGPILSDDEPPPARSPIRPGPPRKQGVRRPSMRGKRPFTGQARMSPPIDRSAGDRSVHRPPVASSPETAGTPAYPREASQSGGEDRQGSVPRPGRPRPRSFHCNAPGSS